MEQHRIIGEPVGVELAFKGGSREIKDTMPVICRDKDYVIQYIGIWKIMFDRVISMNAKIVLEFGTREGYSTRLFSKALSLTGGRITTVDINPPKEPFTEENIMTITMPVEEFSGFYCDILYIDDWHNGFHLYYELNRFAKLAKVVMIHDVSLDNELMDAIREWCRHNMVIYTIYPMNGCGLAVLEIERSGAFYANKNEATSEQGGTK